MRKLRKYIAVILCAAAMVCVFAGCGNHQLFDTTYNYDEAIIQLPNGDIVKGKVDSWCDYEDGDQLQIVIKGKTYLVHSTNAVLIAD